MKKILIVDDQSGIRFFLHELFKERYDVVIAENGEQGLDYFHQNKFHLVLTDMNMPGLDGLGMIKEIRKVDHEIPILVMTAYQETDAVEQLQQLNVSGSITKPFDIMDIQNLVQHYV